MTRALRAWAPALLWAAAIFFASSLPGTGVDLSGGRDKVVHALVYLVLGLLLARAWAPRAGAVLLGWLYAASDELHQALVPGRTAELADWAADALGVLAGVFLFHRVARRRSRRGSRAADPLAASRHS